MGEDRARRYETRVNQSTGDRPRRAWKTWACSALRQQPRGQSNSTGRPSTQPTAAARRQFGQSSQVTRSLASIVLPLDPSALAGDGGPATGFEPKDPSERAPVSPVAPSRNAGLSDDLFRIDPVLDLLSAVFWWAAMDHSLHG